jgi:hypothetical protein
VIRNRRAVGVAAATALFLSAAVPATAHGPTPLIGWPAWEQDQNVTYRWATGEVPPAAMRTAIRAGVDSSNASKRSRAPLIAYADGGTSTVEYGLSVFCGVNGLACADGSNAPRSFRVAFREHGHRFDWGQLRWCQMQSEPTNGCYDVHNIMLDELGHVLGLGHHDNYADDSDYLDSVVQTVSRARPHAGWDAHLYGRCDFARLQTRYDMTSWTTAYSTCLDLDTNLSFTASSTGIRAGSSVTFTAVLSVADNPDDGRLAGNPIARRTVTLQRRPVGGTTWTSMGSMTNATTAGTYTLVQSPTASYDWRAVFATPPAEGLNGRTSGIVRVSVSGCSGSTCPQVAPDDAAAQPGGRP